MSKLFEKMMSGRWILTVIVGWIMLMLSVNPQFMSIDKHVDKILGIIELVVIFYFLREDRNKSEEPKP